MGKAFNVARRTFRNEPMNQKQIWMNEGLQHAGVFIRHAAILHSFFLTVLLFPLIGPDQRDDPQRAEGGHAGPEAQGGGIAGLGEFPLLAGMIVLAPIIRIGIIKAAAWPEERR